MGYIIEPMQLTSFLKENLRLPRFQRKITWDKRRNFELAISIFKDYPIGVIIINQQQKNTWLLDGRQRRTALTTMRSDPVELYNWAKHYLGFKSNADTDEITDIFWKKIHEYLQKESDSEGQNVLNEDIPYDEGDDTSELLADDDSSFDIRRQKDSLYLLLSLILMVHQIRGDQSRWQRLFNFNEFFSFLPYAPKKNQCKVDSKELRNFIYKFLEKLESEYDGELTPQNFMDFCSQQAEEKDHDGFSDYISNNWDAIKESIEIISKSEKLFSEARIGVIKLINASDWDAQNIFSRINTEGTKLETVELLSAKPYWNRSVNITDPDTEDRIKNLYKLVNVTQGETVRWDIAATLIGAINDDGLFFEHKNSVSSKKNEVNMNEVTLGFKLLSAIINEGISKTDISKLETNDKWDLEITNIINEINLIISILLQNKFFKDFQSWQKPLCNLIGNTPVLEFITILRKIWQEDGSIKGYSTEAAHRLQQKAKILFDKLVFEYTTRMWRGSSDSKFANDIKRIPLRIEPVPQENWDDLISSAINGIYKGHPTSYVTLTPILYYYYVLKEILPLSKQGVTYDVDHIIPDSKLKSNTLCDPNLKDSLGNLCLLPKKENIYKGKKLLCDITNDWLKNQISIYAEISKDDFKKFSDLSNMKDMCVERGKLFTQAFQDKRNYILIN